MVDEQLEDIAYFLTTGIVLESYTIAEKKKLVMKAIDYQLIAIQLCKLGVDGILRRCILKHERDDIIKEAHEGTRGGHYVGKETTHKNMNARIWWPTIFKDTKEYYDVCDVCKRAGRRSRRDQMPSNP